MASHRATTNSPAKGNTGNPKMVKDSGLTGAGGSANLKTSRLNQGGDLVPRGGRMLSPTTTMKVSGKSRRGPRQ